MSADDRQLAERLAAVGCDHIVYLPPYDGTAGWRDMLEGHIYVHHTGPHARPHRVVATADDVLVGSQEDDIVHRTIWGPGPVSLPVDEQREMTFADWVRMKERLHR